jgi:glycosyltransferase involved in cell wall biosynthesis
MEAGKIWGTLDPFVEGGEIMGRGVANVGFLDALLARDPFDAYHFFLPDQRTGETVEAHLQRSRSQLLKQGRVRIATRLELPQALRTNEFHCFHLSDCINYPPHLARLRNALARNIFPITGVTHSLSYPRYGAEFLAHLWPGCTPRDAVVATSRAGREVVLGYFDSLRDQYHLDPKKFLQPEVARIPLGIDPEAMALPGEQERAAWRKSLGAGPETVVLLVFSRLSHSSKMDLLPVFRMLQRLAGEGLPLDRFQLVLAGWMRPEEEYPATLRELARNMGLSLVLEPCPDDDLKRELFGAADIFLSPADNLQETFGLSLLEAGLAGLPAVASDFDGYRDIVEHGVTGLLVPTLAPAETETADALARVWFDNQHHLLMAQQTVVDVAALAQSVGALTRDPEMRLSMGRAARERVLAQFAWPVVIQSYVDLWEELAARPVDQDQEQLRSVRHPAHTDYGRVFAAYPTESYDPALTVVWSRTGQAVYRGREGVVVHGGLAAFVREFVVGKIPFLARHPIAMEALAERIRELEPSPGESAMSQMSMEEARCHVLWALKHDLLERDGKEVL